MDVVLAEFEKYATNFYINKTECFLNDNDLRLYSSMFIGYKNFKDKIFTLKKSTGYDEINPRNASHQIFQTSHAGVKNLNTNRPAIPTGHYPHDSGTDTGDTKNSSGSKKVALLIEDYPQTSRTDTTRNLLLFQIPSNLSSKNEVRIKNTLENKLSIALDMFLNTESDENNQDHQDYEQAVECFEQFKTYERLNVIDSKEIYEFVINIITNNIEKYLNSYSDFFNLINDIKEKIHTKLFLNNLDKILYDQFETLELILILLLEFHSVKITPELSKKRLGLFKLNSILAINFFKALYQYAELKLNLNASKNKVLNPAMQKESDIQCKTINLIKNFPIYILDLLGKLRNGNQC
ncbi:hypothetical protein GVAV_002248 [Gurleya vavrai]